MRSEKTGRSWSFLLPLEADNLCLSQEENHHDRNQKMGVKTNPRPKKERLIPLNTPTLSNRPHRKGLGVEGAELDGAEDHHGQH